MTIAKYLFVALIFGAISAGCGDCGSGETPTSDRVPCAPDPDRVAERNRCQDDDDCPCGTNCSLGRCEAQCTDDSQCGDDQRCDTFGRCRDAEDNALVPLAPAESAGNVRALLASQVFPEVGTTTVTFQAGDDSVARTRVEGTGGAKVRCPGETEFADECFVEDTEPGDTIEVEVERDTDAMVAAEAEGEAGPTVTAYTEAGQDSVSLPALTDQPGYLPESERSAPEQLQGTYRGTLRVAGIGTASEGTDLQASPTGHDIEITADVWDDGDDVVIEIADPLNFLTSEPSYVGSLTVEPDTDGDGTFIGVPTFVDHPFIETVVAGRTTRLLARPGPSALLTKQAPRSLTLSLTNHFVGSGTDDAPAIRYILELARAGDVSGTAPTQPAPAMLGYDPSERAEELSPWTQTVTGTFGGSNETVPLALRDMARSALGLRPNDLRSCEPGIVSSTEFRDELTTLDIGADNPNRDVLFEAVFRQVLQDNTAFQIGGYNRVRANTTAFPNATAIPCRVNVTGVAMVSYAVIQDVNTHTSSASIDTDVDVCATLQETLGCQVMAVNEPLDTGRISSTWTNTTTTETATGSVRLIGETLAYCTPPDVPTTCAEQVSCADPESTEAALSLAGHGFSGPPEFAPSGDAYCNDSTSSGTPRNGGFDIDITAATRAEALSKCLADVAMLASVPRPTTQGYGAGLNDLFASNGCVSFARLISAVELQGRTRAATSAAPIPAAEAVSATYSLRLLSRWLQLHSFMALEGKQIQQMSSVLDGRRIPTNNQELPTPSEITAATVDSLDLLLEPSFIRMLGSLPGETIGASDYRGPRFGNFDTDPLTSLEVERAFPTTVMETLAHQADWIRIALGERGNGSLDEVIEPTQEWIPKMLVVQALSAKMYREALAADPNLAWQDRYESKRLRLAGKAGELFALIDAIRLGANPLGISDSDLPLYFQTSQGMDATGRFTAISDFLLGSGAGDGAWAPTLVTQSQELLADARLSLIEEHDRFVRTQREQADYRQWNESVRNEYNGILTDYCGPAPAEIGSWVDQPDFDPRTCSKLDTLEGCEVNLNEWYENWTEQDLLGRFCLHSDLTATAPEPDTSVEDPTNDLLDATIDPSLGLLDDVVRDFGLACIEESGSDATEVMHIADCVDAADGSCLKCLGAPSLGEVRFGSSSLEIAIASTVQDQQSYVIRRWNRALSKCQEEHPGMRLHVPVATNRLFRPGCLNGSIGEGFLDVAVASSNLDSARAEIAEHQDAYDIAMRSCFILRDTNEALEVARDQHTENIKDLRKSKFVADTVSIGAGAVKDCMAAGAGIGGDPVSAVTGAVGAGASCQAGYIQAAADIESTKFELEIDLAQDAHENLVADIEAEGDLKTCFNDAKQELVGMRTAAIQLDSAVFDLQRSIANAGAMMDAARSDWADGYSYLQDLENDPLPTPMGDVWANETISEYLRKFKLARRATYLAVRAVEYEFQASLGQRADVFEAETPSDLEAVLDNLRSITGTRDIGGARASELLNVLSLRDDVLRLADESAWPEELQPLSVADRFKLVLNNERYAVYGDDGGYLGQRVPFTLAPLGAIGFESGGVPIYSPNDCAERLWSVNASILGEDLYRGNETSFVRLDVLKRNTFFSQWCGGVPEGAEDYQIATVRPNRNLFREPGLGSDFGGSLGVNRGVEDFSRARIQAYFNVDQAGLEDPQYANGETSELAARGLYGDYALFIPAELISRDGSNGLVLDNVDDILLRVDYVSVANN